MRIAIAGMGELGRFYAERWLREGHEVVFTHVRDAAKADAAVEALGRGASWVPSLADAPRPDVAVVAARLESIDGALESLGPLSGVVVIDAVNPFTPDRTGLVDLGGRTAADVVGDALAARGGGRHVKALHSDGVQRILAMSDSAAVFVAGDDAGAVDAACALIRDAGLEPVVTGGLATAAWSEPPGALFGQGFTAAAARAALAPLTSSALEDLP